MVRSFLNNYFGFNRQQRNGLLVLMGVSLLLLIVRIVYPFFMKESEIEVRYIPLAYADSAQKDSSVLFSFDPNTAAFDELLKLGFSKQAATTLIKYRKGHRLEKKEDLLQVYGVSHKLYNNLLPYIRFERKDTYPVPQKLPKAEKNVSPRQRLMVELNSADSVTLESVPGIGPVFARRILKYRLMLGGFANKEQLREVYGIDSEAFDRIKDYVTADEKKITPVRVNSDDFKTVNRHPYISYELTKAVFNARRKGPLDITQFRELVNNDSIAARLAPYVTF